MFRLPFTHTHLSLSLSYSLHLFSLSLYNFNLMENKHITCFRNELLLNEIKYECLFSRFFLSALSFVRVSWRVFYLCVLVASTWNVNNLSVAVFLAKVSDQRSSKNWDCIIFVFFFCVVKTVILSSAVTCNNSLHVMFNNNGSKIIVFFILITWQPRSFRFFWLIQCQIWWNQS